MAQTFHIINDAIAILRSKGVYRQCKVYEREGVIYAGHGSGFIMLKEQGTSVPSISVDGYELGFEPEFTKLGVMVKPQTRLPHELKAAA